MLEAEEEVISCVIRTGGGGEPVDDFGTVNFKFLTDKKTV